MVQRSIGAVLVTYKDRSKYFKKVIQKLNEFQEVSAIVLVDNGITGNSITELGNLQNNCKKLTVVSQGYNSGSAKGFKDGILESLKKKVDFIWLLDDDNLPNENTLKALTNNIDRVKSLTNNNIFSLLSYRPDRKIYKKAIQSNNPYAMLGGNNAFLGFNLMDRLKKREVIKYNENIKIGKVAVAPYGGMFFHKSLLNEIGMPDERFFVYADDHEFSYRITKNKGSIFLILKSQLQDLEKSFHLKKSKKILNTRFSSTNSKDAIYFSVRNNIYFEKNFVTNKVIYKINKITYIFILFLMMILNPMQFWKFPVIIKAIKDSGKFMSYD